MGWLDGIKAFVNAINTEYDRRIRAASNVKEYKVGGHGTQNGHGDTHAHVNEVERLEGEGGALGDLQANAGPQLHRSQGEERTEAIGDRTEAIGDGR